MSENDITMSLDDTLELDTIIENWSNSSNFITDEDDGFQLSGIQTK